MKIAFASSEVYPFAKTGGLGDVIGALPKALQEMGCHVKVFVPKYAIIDHSKFVLTYDWSIGEMPIRVAGRVHNVNVYMSTLPESNVEVYFIDCPFFFNRSNIYTGDHDEDERFILYSKAVIESLQRLQWQPDIIHCNDWQTGLIPFYIKENYNWDYKFLGNTATVMSIHNVAYQGRFPKETVVKAEIRPELFYPNSPIEVWGAVCFLKIGLMYADVINTVSKTYAEEITTSDKGMGLQDILRYRINDFYGILNGVDYSVWNPQSDKYIPSHFSAENLTGKAQVKEYLLNRLHLPIKPGVPLIGIISRLVDQKGFDLVADSINELMQFNAQWIILGSGDERLENLFRGLSYAFPDSVSTYIGFNNELSHVIEAGADMFLMPSQFEPCGLNQIYSLKYGTVPIVRKTGGLADTVLDWHEMAHLGKDTGTGISFMDYNTHALVSSVGRALELFQNKEIWSQIIQNGMKQDFSWSVSAKEYIELYKKAIYNRRVL